MNDSPPSLVVEPVDTVAGYGGPGGPFVSATLSCQARPEDAAITWYKDDLPVEMVEIPGVQARGGLLTVGTRDSTDDGGIVEGFYYCLAANGVGTVRSRTALVKGRVG